MKISKITPSLPEPGAVLSPVKSWVLAMLAPQRGRRVAAVPPLRGEFDLACARRRCDGRSGRRNRRHNRTKEHGLARIPRLADWAIRQIRLLVRQGRDET
jgi:hypothetical protein